MQTNDFLNKFCGLLERETDLYQELLTIIDKVDSKGRPTKHRKYYIGSQYRFYPYDIKPDSADNWIRLHKNYRLTK